MARVLIISVHPDDETLGCGGVLLRHSDSGDELHWLIATVTYKPQWSAELIEKKAREIEEVAEAYGMVSVSKLQLPTVRLDTIPQAEIISNIREVVEAVRPEIVYLVHDGDVHSDHHAVFTAAMSVFKAFYMSRWGTRRILCYETLSSTEAAPPQFSRMFVPTVYHDITQYVDRKIEIMDLYETELQPDPYPRGPAAIRALARYRGATVGVDYAEAFMLIREVC